MWGDTIMPSQFDQLYGAKLKKVIKKRKRGGAVILAKDPISKRKFDVGTTGYADDIAETKLAAAS